ncbi:ATP-binding cassette domain-containing protein [Streptomyces sp. NPDC018057]|uniref:ATP-binding cassette domain-containing protein n=1 Tax=unclassified Streptomyces TaxID=2593676 RepID=UPI0037B22A07
MIQAFGLTSDSRKGRSPAVDDVSFEAHSGRVTALLGTAGAGKTTTLRLMLELQQGRGITYFKGRPLHRIAHPAREVGVLLGDVPGHPSRSVRGHLRMLCAAAGLPARRADEVLEAVGLVSFRDERLGMLSRGMDRRLGLACVLLSDPHTLVLDHPAGGVSPREGRWLHGMLRAHAGRGGTVLFATDDPKEAARTADRVVTLERGSVVADQEATDFARHRLRPRVAVLSPHAARLAALLAKEARTARRSVEVVREDGNRLFVYGSTCADVGETAFRHGILVHQLADEVGDMGAGAGAHAGAGAERAAAEHPFAERAHTGEPGAPAAGETSAAPAAGTAPGLPGLGSVPSVPSASLVRDDGGAVGAQGGTAHAATDRGGAVAATAPGGPGATPRKEAEETVAADLLDHGRPEAVSVAAHAEGSTTAAAHADSVPTAARPHVGGVRVRSGDAPRTDRGDRGGSPEESRDGTSGARPAARRRPGPHQSPHQPPPEQGAQPGPQPDPRSQGPARAPGPQGSTTHPSTAHPSTAHPSTAHPSTTHPSIAQPSIPTPRPAEVVTADASSLLPPPIAVRPGAGPLRPLRYELRRALGIGTGFAVCAAVLVVSALTALVMGHIGHTPQPRLLAAWPQQLPLPPAALGAGLLGALAFGDEFRHPALAADRGTVPRRLGLLAAKLLVATATAALLAFLTIGCDAELLYLVYGGELTQVPGDWLSPAASWTGLVIGCGWTGVLASGVFRSATAGLAAVLAVPVVGVPLVREALGGAAWDTAGLPARLHETFLLSWPFGGDRWLAAAARVVAQPLGSALGLSLTALLGGYLLTVLRGRAR